MRDRRLIIYGVIESDGEDTIGIALDELNKVLLDATTQYKSDPKYMTRRPKFRSLVIDDIDGAYRMGRQVKGKKKMKPRNISVAFSMGYIKHMILSAKEYMKKKPKNFYINEDLRPEARAYRSDLKKIAAGASALGMETSGNKLIIDAEIYQPDEISALGDNIIQASSLEKVLKDGIAFKGDRSVFSYFFPAPFSIDDKDFVSVEQFFQFTKADVCGDDRLARKIMAKSNPWYIKTVGGPVEETKQWRSIRLRTLYNGIFAKFDQNGPLKQVLISSAGQNLYEATTDMYYGCGINIDSDLWTTGGWKGASVCGKILMKNREESLTEFALGQPTDDTLADLMTSSIDSSSTSNISMMDAECAGDSNEPPPNDQWPVVGSQLSYKEVVKSP